MTQTEKRSRHASIICDQDKPIYRQQFLVVLRGKLRTSWRELSSSTQSRITSLLIRLGFLKGCICCIAIRGALSRKIVK